MTPLVIEDLTTGALLGTGVFDKMMATNKAHLEAEYGKDRIKGAEYAQVYLGVMDTTMNQAMQFLLQSRRMEVELALIEAQVLLANVQVQLAEVEVLKAQVEMEILEANKDKIAAEVLLITQQKVNLAAEALNIPKQGAVIDAQAAQHVQQTANLVSEKLGIEARTALSEQQTLNAITENLVLIAQKCKLEAEFDLLVNTNLKTSAEIQLLIQKTATEKAQTMTLGVDEDSVIGKQKALYTAQTEGFTRDAEQKAAKVMVDTWNARRMTDEATVADGTNMLNDAAVGRAVNKLLQGVGA